MKKPYFIFFLPLLFLFTSTSAQVVSTFFNDPTFNIDDAMILDAQGNLYGSNFNGSNIYKISPSGIASVFASGISSPNGLAFDSNQNLFVCDLNGNRIFKISPAGVFLDTFPTAAPSGIIKMQNSDTMIFTQYLNHRVSKLDPNGNITLIKSGLPLNGPVGLCYDDSGQLYVANFNTREVFSMTGNTLTHIAYMPGPAGGWLGFLTYAQGSLWGTGYNDHKIYRIYQNYVDSTSLFAGNTIGNVDGPIGTASFNAPNGILPSVTGDSLYISDYNTGNIRIISGLTPTGIQDLNSTNGQFSVYPCPTNDMVNIKTEFKIEMVELYSLAGKLLMKEAKKSFSIKTLADGIYLLKITSEKQVYSGKIVKN